jgi:hypothetical protein
MVTGEDREDGACALALQNLGQDAPRTDWDRMSQLREEVIGQESAVIGEEGRSSCFKFFLIQNLKLLLFPHSRSFAFIRGSEILYKSRRCGAASPYLGKRCPAGCVAQPAGRRRSPFEEVASSSSVF